MTQQRKTFVSGQSLALFLIATVLIVNGARVLRAVEEVSQDAWVTWIKKTAIQLQTLDWRTVNLKDLRSLDDKLEGKRVIYLGEPDHYIHEKYNYRLILIRYLFEKGWRYVGMEMGRSDGMRADRFLETGDHRWLEQMAVYGYLGDRRKNRDDKYRPGKAQKNPGFVKAIVTEEKWFFEQLRSINQNLAPGQSRLCWFGYDADMYPGGGYRDARELLDKHSKTQLAQKILNSLALVENETAEEEVERLKGVLAIIIKNKDDLQQLLGKNKTDELKGIVHCLLDSMKFRIARKAGYDLKLMVPAYREREKTMFRQINELLDRLPPEEKIILMGHNLHLSKNYKSIRFSGVNMWPSIGSHVNQKLQGKVYSIWMLYDHGWSADVSKQSIKYIHSHPGRIESLMARAGHAFILPLNSPDPRATYLDKERGFVVNGDAAFGLLRKNADAIFFISEVTATGEGH